MKDLYKNKECFNVSCKTFKSKN